jgi:hypothetical protein
VDAKFTPGPWKIRESPHENALEIYSDTRDEIALVRIDDTDADSLAETLANAAAIGALPGLYAACRATLDRLDYLRELWGDEGITRGLCDTLRAAVAKAEEGGGS